MSMNFLPSILDAVDCSAAQPGWDSALARFTRMRREELGLSLERAAELSGLELSEWCALESGWVPDPADLGRIHAIAGTLQTSWIEFAFFALLNQCQEPASEAERVEG